MSSQGLAYMFCIIMGGICPPNGTPMFPTEKSTINKMEVKFSFWIRDVFCTQHFRGLLGTLKTYLKS